MPLPVHRHSAPARLPDLFDWLEAPWSALTPFGTSQSFRVEDYMKDGKFTIRAELPGVDPEKDVQVTVESGVLTIRAERREETQEERHSEFRYGSFERSVSLPQGADPDQVTARYDHGILEVTVPVPEHAVTGGRRIAIEHTN